MHQSDTLVRMANQIAKFFAVQGEERATSGIAEHIKKFWEPRMKAAIFAHIEAGGAGLHPLALKALQRLQAAYGSTASSAPPVKPSAPPAAPKGKKGSGQRGKAAAR